MRTLAEVKDVPGGGGAFESMTPPWNPSLRLRSGQALAASEFLRSRLCIGGKDGAPAYFVERDGGMGHHPTES